MIMAEHLAGEMVDCIVNIVGEVEKGAASRRPDIR